MTIEVNNGRSVKIESCSGGVSVKRLDSDGTIESKEFYDEGEIIMVLNVLRFMKAAGLKTLYLFDDQTQRYLDNLLANGDIVDFRIFQ